MDYIGFTLRVNSLHTLNSFLIVVFAVTSKMMVDPLAIATLFPIVTWGSIFTPAPSEHSSWMVTLPLVITPGPNRIWLPRALWCSILQWAVMRLLFPTFVP